jgi:hypothetical protein
VPDEEYDRHRLQLEDSSEEQPVFPAHEQQLPVTADIDDYLVLYDG